MTIDPGGLLHAALTGLAFPLVAWAVKRMQRASDERTVAANERHHELKDLIERIAEDLRGVRETLVRHGMRLDYMEHSRGEPTLVDRPPRRGD